MNTVLGGTGSRDLLYRSSRRRKSVGRIVGQIGEFPPLTWLSTRAHNPLVAGSSPAGPTPFHPVS